MTTNECNNHYLTLLKLYSIRANIETIHDPAAPPHQTAEEDSLFTITLNTAKFSPAEYESALAYQARKLLLAKGTLQTERLILRHFQSGDEIDCFAFFSDKVSCYYNCFDAFTAMDEEYRQLMQWFGSQENRFMVVRRDTGRVIGSIHLAEDNSRAVDAIEIGYTIAAAYQRQGFAQESLCAVIEALHRFRLDLLLAGTMAENAPSIRLLEKLGFQKEGIHHKAIWHDALGPIDLVFYYLDR